MRDLTPPTSPNGNECVPDSSRLRWVKAAGAGSRDQCFATAVTSQPAQVRRGLFDCAVEMGRISRGFDSCPRRRKPSPHFAPQWGLPSG